MKNIITLTKSKTGAKGAALIAGMLLVGLLELPALFIPGLKPLSEPFATATNLAGQVETAITAPITNVFFKADAATSAVMSKVGNEINFVSSRSAYPASLAVVQKHADEIKTAADAHHVPEDVAIGVALLENGGSETAKSPAGALGVYQLMPATARNLGLTVNSREDDRANPEKSIEAGVTYLAGNYDRFGDWGLATWAYHAGEGNVAKALRIYAAEHDGIQLPGVENSQALKDYVVSHGITINTLLSDPGVEAFTSKLHDDSAGYPYKVVATATLFRQAGS